MTSSSESLQAEVVSRETVTTVREAEVPELPTGPWTRLGQRSVHGDAVTEGALDGLAGSIRSKARSQGYSVGWAQGRRQAVLEAQQQEAEREAEAKAAERRRAEEHADALTALRRAAQSLHEQAAVVAARVEDSALELARELTRCLVDHELRTAPDPAGDTVRRALALLPEPDAVPVTLRLHPDVAAAAASDDLRSRGVRVVPDASLDTCDAVLETDDTVVDARVSEALGRVMEVLS
jgi:flagellar assembly protein FliH